MKKFIIDEQERKNILKMYGLINEDYDPKTSYSDGLIPAKSYQIIEDIEHYMGRANEESDGTWKLTATDHKGNELEDRIKEILGLYPGIINNWFDIDPLFRTQIYSYIFQSGSDPNIESPKNRRWLAGLAQTIDNTVSRGDVINDKDGAAEKAAKIVENSITAKTINNFYENYKKKVVEQYNSLSPNKKKPDENSTPEYKKEYEKDEKIFEKQKEMVWKNRPQIIEDLYNGKSTIQDIVSKMVSNNYNLPGSEKKSENTKVINKNNQELQKNDEKDLNTNQSKSDFKDVNISKSGDNVNNNLNVNNSNNQEIQKNDKESLNTIQSSSEINSDNKNNVKPSRRLIRVQRRIKRITDRIKKLDPTWKSLKTGEKGMFDYVDDGPKRDKYDDLVDRLKRNQEIEAKLLGKNSNLNWEPDLVTDYTKAEYDKLSDEQKKDLQKQGYKPKENGKFQDPTELKLRHYPEVPHRADPAWGTTSWELKPF